MVGQVGNDRLGSLLLDSLQSAGVNTEHVGELDKPTGTAVIFVLPDAENLIVISPGANATGPPGVAEAQLANLGPRSLLLCQLAPPGGRILSRRINSADHKRLLIWTARRHAAPLRFQAPNRSVGAQHAVPARTRPKRECIYEMEYLAAKDARIAPWDCELDAKTASRSIPK